MTSTLRTLTVPGRCAIICRMDSRTNELLEKLVKILCKHVHGTTRSVRDSLPDQWGVVKRTDVYRCKVCGAVVNEVE